MFKFIHRPSVRVLAAGAVVALGAMIAAPANALPTDPGPINDVVLQSPGVQPYGDYDMSGTSKGDVEATFFGGTYGCDGATASGTFHSSGFTNHYLELSSMNISNCATPFPPLTVGVSLNSGCHVTFDADTSANSVHTALTDTTVTGTMHASDSGTPCVHVNGPLGVCSMDIGGDVPAAFDEVDQQLTIGGSGLTIESATSPCGSLAGQPVSFTVDFDVSAVDHNNNPGDINFRP